MEVHAVSLHHVAAPYELAEFAPLHTLHRGRAEQLDAQ